VSQSLVDDLDGAAAQARRLIHDNDIDRLKQLLKDYPALLSWQRDDDHGGLLGFATGAYGDAFDPKREESFTRAACAELLIDAGAVVTPAVYRGILWSRARGMLRLLYRKGVLPRTLRFLAALGDLEGVRAALSQNGQDLATVNDAFMVACRFEHEAVASLLLDRSISLDPELGHHVDGRVGRVEFIKYLMKERALTFVNVTPVGPWQAFLMERAMRAIQEADLATFTGELQREPWMLGEDTIGLQVGMIERATLQDREPFITALLALDPALLRQQPPPSSQAIEIAFTYAHSHLIPLLTRIWPLPDELPNAAGLGDLTRVKRWFKSDGHVDQKVLDTALAYAVINRHFDVADFLLAHGANINTIWNSHEPASILHHLVFLPDNYERMQFLIDRGIDMSIEDYRWNSSAIGWARYGASDEKMAQWLEDAQRRRETSRS